MDTTITEHDYLVRRGYTPPADSSTSPNHAIFGADSAETAYTVDDYPYGFRLRTQIRYWIETTKHGDRFVSQTIDPRNGRWNKPKASTYVGVAVMLRDPSNGHISYCGCTENDRAEWIGVFRAAFWDELSAAQQRRLLAIIGYTRATSKIKWSVQDTTGWTAEQHTEQQRQAARDMRNLGRMIAVETRDAVIESVTA